MYASIPVAALCATIALVGASPLPSADAQAAKHKLTVEFGPYATDACLMSFGPGGQTSTATLNLTRGHCVDSPYTFYSYWVWGSDEAAHKSCEVKMFETSDCKGKPMLIEPVPSIYVGCVIPMQAVTGNSVKMTCG